MTSFGLGLLTLFICVYSQTNSGSFFVDVVENVAVVKKTSDCYVLQLNQHEQESMLTLTGLKEIESHMETLVSSNAHRDTLTAANITSYTKQIQNACKAKIYLLHG